MSRRAHTYQISCPTNETPSYLRDTQETIAPPDPAHRCTSQRTLTQLQPHQADQPCTHTPTLYPIPHAHRHPQPTNPRVT